MRALLFLVVLGLGLYWYLGGIESPQSVMTTPARAAGGCQSLVVYAATWCPACDRKRADLNAHNVIFTEHFVDKNAAKDREFRRKATAARRRIAYPTLEVGGEILPHNYRAADLITHFNVCHR
ncbi:MAG TPA: hypothetical protein DDX54_02660 [Rhodospirillaceae bacterium]|mgnify:CR=1 FL=1|jgi:glutaredoxin|nr:hypothetical protein [Alphaproteobacteria bacterium]HBH26287.1 hypothetical protein [Rhodospirillaceae bacterium]